MIELWRQCVTATGSSPAGVGYEYMSVGALRAGGELREVRLVVASSGSMMTEFYLALAATPEATATSFAAATPLMQGPSMYRLGGKPGWREGLSIYYPRMTVFPFAVTVESGSRWVHVAWLRSATRILCVVVTATVIGFAPLDLVERAGAARD